SRQSGGRGQYGDVHIEFTPNETGAGFEFENAIVDGVVPRVYIPSVEAGLKDAMENGVLAGYPLIDVKAEDTKESIDQSDQLTADEKTEALAMIKQITDQAKQGITDATTTAEVEKAKPQGLEAFDNIQIDSTGAAKAIGKVIPEIDGKLDGGAQPVP
ncbi:DUF1542 domain-containing protein, partial [Staphylococcus aureus]|uniref:DUF1542 domain-containing protein n=1 Tax=Staphylococcus aureus TaxID=1280 RepID=UPI0021099330